MNTQPFTPDPALINRELAYRAHAGTSFDPEKRGEMEIASFVSEVDQVRKTLMQSAESIEELATVDEEMNKFQERYAKKWNDQMASRSRIHSPMITGPANFPVSRNQKANVAYYKRLTEMGEYKERMIKAVNKKLNARRVDEAGGEFAMLKEELASAEAAHVQMKAVNKILRNKKTSAEEKVKRVHEDCGLSEQIIHDLMNPVVGSSGYASFSLTNNNARIKRMKARVAEMQAREDTSTSEIEFNGGTIIDNCEDDRVQILFDDKPDDEMRGKLKGSGWRWSPSVGVWQRKRTSNAMASAKQILEV